MVNPLSAAISFSPTQVDTERPVRSVGGAHAPTDLLQRPLSPHQLTLILSHTHTNKTNDFSISGSNKRGSPCSKQFSVQHASERKRGRTGRWKKHRVRELLFSFCLENNDTPGEEIAKRRASLFTVKMICRALSLPLMLYKR